MEIEDISRESYKILQNMYIAMNESQRRMETNYSMKELYCPPLDYYENVYQDEYDDLMYSGSE